MDLYPFMRHARAFLVVGCVLQFSCETVADNAGDEKILRDFGLARLEAPQPIGPKDGAQMAITHRITISWHRVKDADSYTLQLATDSTLQSLFAEYFLDTTLVSPPVLSPAWYFWRVRSLKGDRSFSPWSEMRAFRIGSGQAD